MNSISVRAKIQVVPNYLFADKNQVPRVHAGIFDSWRISWSRSIFNSNILIFRAVCLLANSQETQSRAESISRPVNVKQSKRSSFLNSQNQTNRHLNVCIVERSQRSQFYKSCCWKPKVHVSSSFLQVKSCAKTCFCNLRSSKFC